MSDEINKKNDFIEDSGLPEEAKKQVRQALNPDEIIENVQVPASYIPIHIHTQGKFSTPKLLHFKDYNTPQLNDLSIMTEENALENIVRILKENCYEDFDIGQCTQEELVEILGTVLANFWRNKVKIPWICECQMDIEYDDERKTEYYDINLKNITIHQVREDVFEPIKVNLKENEYNFRFVRINDIIYAKNKIKEKYIKEQKQIDNYTAHGITKDDLRYKKREMQKELNMKKFKEIIILSKSQCLLNVNGKGIPREKRQEELDKIDPATVTVLFNKMNELKIGYESEYETECSICKEKKSRRLLFQPSLFLPTDGQRELGTSATFVGI